MYKFSHPCVRNVAHRHLAEFWMIEPELAFADLQDDMNCAEDYVRFCIRHLLEHCMDDMEFITKMIDKDALNRCRQVIETPFKRISYVSFLVLCMFFKRKEVMGVGGGVWLTRV